MKIAKRKSTASSFVTPYLQRKLTFNLDDYGKKASVCVESNKEGRAEITLP
jgi:hypothetical protein